MEQLLQHLRDLSDASLDESQALRLFAACFSDSYGPSSLFILQRHASEHSRLRLVNLDGVQATAPADNPFHMHIDSDIWLSLPQLRETLEQEQPLIVEQGSGEWLGALAEFVPTDVALMLLPLFLDGQVNYWGLIAGTRAGQYRQVNIEQAMLLANLAATYMSRIAETRQLSRANAWINKELDDIGRIHRLLLPEDMQAIRGAKFVTHFRASERTGGDYYDVVKLSGWVDKDYPPDQDDIWGAIVADASGHGAAAAVEVAMFDAILRTYRGDPEQGPAAVFNYANHYFFTRTDRGSYITATIMNYDPRSRCLRYANAGHPPALLKAPGRDSIIELDESHSIPLGVDQQWQWDNAEISVEPGSILVAYTDGLIEAVSVDGEQFGAQRLKALVAEHAGDIDDLADRILGALGSHVGETPAHDDLTLMIIGIDA